MKASEATLSYPTIFLSIYSWNTYARLKISVLSLKFSGDV